MERKENNCKILLVCAVVLMCLCALTHGYDKLKTGIVKYGGICNEDYECEHWRMYCDSEWKNCSCWRFHDLVVYANGTSECVENMEELLKWLSQVKQNYNFSRDLANEAHSLFFYFGLAGILSLGIGFLLAVGCVIMIVINHKPHQKY